MHCSNCGNKLIEDAEFCGRCGKVIANKTTVTEPTAAIPGSHGNKNLNYAGFWKRLAAFVIDWFVLLIISFIVGFIIGFVYTSSAGNSQNVGATAEIMALLACWIYYAAMESSKKQATLGKLALGIIVTDLNGNRISFGRASGRFFGKILSGLIFGMGFLTIGLTSKKQGLHDVMAGCLVINKNI